jgi:hypothetical protein
MELFHVTNQLYFFQILVLDPHHRYRMARRKRRTSSSSLSRCENFAAKLRIQFEILAAYLRLLLFIFPYISKLHSCAKLQIMYNALNHYFIHSKKFWNAKITIWMLHGGHLQICFSELPVCTERLVIWTIKYCRRKPIFLYWKSLFVS